MANSETRSVTCKSRAMVESSAKDEKVRKVAEYFHIFHFCIILFSSQKLLYLISFHLFLISFCFYTVKIFRNELPYDWLTSVSV